MSDAIPHADSVPRPEEPELTDTYYIPERVLNHWYDEEVDYTILEVSWQGHEESSEEGLLKMWVELRRFTKRWLESLPDDEKAELMEEIETKSAEYVRDKKKHLLKSKSRNTTKGANTDAKADLKRVRDTRTLPSGSGRSLQADMKTLVPFVAASRSFFDVDPNTLNHCVLVAFNNAVCSKLLSVENMQAAEHSITGKRTLLGDWSFQTLFKALRDTRYTLKRMLNLDLSSYDKGVYLVAGPNHTVVFDYDYDVILDGDMFPLREYLGSLKRFAVLPVCRVYQVMEVNK